MIYIKREILGNPSRQPNWYERHLRRLFFVAFSAAILFPILAFFLRFETSGWQLLDPMQADAYGMFLVHYPIVLWLQYWLFDYDLPAIVKAAIAFLLTVALSWALTLALRRIPGATKRVVTVLAVIARSAAQRRSNPSLRKRRKCDCCASLVIEDVLRLAAHIGRQPALER